MGKSMAKTMAVISYGTITNMVWCNSNTPETETLIDPADRPVSVGDAYENGKFYRNGGEILTPLEEAQKKLAGLEAAYTEGVNSV